MLYCQIQIYQIRKNAIKMLFFVFISADVSGSLEAIVNILSRYHSPDITLNLLHAGVGPVTENDLKMLQSSQGFNIMILLLF